MESTEATRLLATLCELDDMNLEAEEANQGDPPRMTQQSVETDVDTIITTDVEASGAEEDAGPKKKKCCAMM